MPFPTPIFIGQYLNFSFFSSGHSPFGKATYRLNPNYSGLVYPLALGKPEMIGRILLLRNFFYGFLYLIPLALCFYAAAAWLSRDRSKRFIYFGLLCLFFSLHCMYPFLHQLKSIRFFIS